jgi:ABC-2 type transport system permease protein
MSSLIRFFIRISAFVGKEFLEVLRQTPLILTLVLGPFLILLLFGIGFQNKARPLHTKFVIPENPALKQQVEEYASSLDPQLIYEGTLTDEEAALNALRQGSVDIVVVIPPDAPEKINNNQQAVIELFHNEIDPYQIAYIESFGQVYIDELNRGLLRSVASQGQEDASSIQGKVRSARANVQQLLQALEEDNSGISEGEKEQLYDDVEAITFLVNGSLNLLESMNSGLSGGETNTQLDQTDAIQDSLTNINQSKETLEDLPGDRTNLDEGITSLKQMENGLGSLETQLSDFQSFDPYVLVAPFRSETRGLEQKNIDPTSFFAPAVVVLLLQHLSVTFASLAIVREQNSGTMEIFRISPLGAFETLAGKYLSYLMVGGILAVIITATVVLVLGVPMLGRWVDYALAILALLFASLGLGFLISLIAKTDMQAVQYSMFILLGSVFFSGFFLDLRFLWWPVRAISWVFPATSGIRLLQDITLRGNSLTLYLFYSLLAMGIGLFVVSWISFHRRLRQE